MDIVQNHLRESQVDTKVARSVQQTIREIVRTDGNVSSPNDRLREFSQTQAGQMVMRLAQEIMKELNLTYTEQVFLQESGLPADSNISSLTTTTLLDLMDVYKQLEAQSESPMRITQTDGLHDEEGFRPPPRRRRRDGYGDPCRRQLFEDIVEIGLDEEENGSWGSFDVENTSDNEDDDLSGISPLETTVLRAVPMHSEGDQRVPLGYSHASSLDASSSYLNFKEKSHQQVEGFDPDTEANEQHFIELNDRQIAGLRNALLIPPSVPLSPTAVQVGHSIVLNASVYVDARGTKQFRLGQVQDCAMQKSFERSLLARRTHSSPRSTAGRLVSPLKYLPRTLNFSEEYLEDASAEDEIYEEEDDDEDTLVPEEDESTLKFENNSTVRSGLACSTKNRSMRGTPHPKKDYYQDESKSNFDPTSRMADW